MRSQPARRNCPDGASSPALAMAVALLAICAACAPTQTQAGAQSAPLTPDQLAIIDKAEKPSGGAHLRYAPAPTDPIGPEVWLPFRDGSIKLVKKGMRLRSDGSASWYGEVEETGERAVLMLWGNALLTGYFAYKGTIFAVESLGGGVHAFAELGQNRLLPDHPEPAAGRDTVATPDPKPATTPPRAPPEPSVAPFSDADRKALEAKNITIDVMILYTSNVAKRYVRDPEDLLALAMEETNATFRSSGLGNISLRLVHTEKIDYDGAKGDQFTHLYTMVDGLGPFKDVKKLRNEKRADIVGLIIDNPTGCGLATRIRPDSDEAFFVVHHACATISLSIAHEIGHILGVRHDRFIDASEVPFAYGHGYVNGAKWRDIMSYNAGCGGCPRMPFWSNPRLTYKGEPTGTPATDSARVILELAERVSKFR